MHIEQSINLIKRSHNILCLTQKNASSDGIAGILALQVLIHRLKKDCCVVAPENVIKKLDFLTGYDLIHPSIPGSNEVVIKINQDVKEPQIINHNNYTEITIQPNKKKIDIKSISIAPKITDFDLIIAVDMPNLESLGTLFQEQVQLFTNTPIISISANPSHDCFGRVCLSSTKDSSSSEIIFNLIDQSEFSQHLDETIATILLTGIIDSTGSFLEQNTTPNSLKAASILQKKGARQSDIIENLFKKKSLATLKIWGRILGNLQLDENHKIAWSNLQKSDFTLTESSAKDIDDISDNLLRFTSETEIYTILYEEENQTSLQIRTANPTINIQELQKNFGGEVVKNGLNITVKDKSIADIEGNFLKMLTNFQKKRLNLEKSLKIHTKSLEKKSKPKTTHLDLHLKPKAKHHTAKAPNKIPFSAPQQPHETTGKIGDDGSSKEVRNQKITKSQKGYSPKQSGIPEWLKR